MIGDARYFNGIKMSRASDGNIPCPRKVAANEAILWLDHNQPRAILLLGTGLTSAQTQEIKRQAREYIAPTGRKLET